MPPRRATRNTRAKAPATLSPEEQQVQRTFIAFSCLLQPKCTATRPVQPASGGLWQAVRKPESRGCEGGEGSGRLDRHPLQVVVAFIAFVTTLLSGWKWWKFPWRPNRWSGKIIMSRIQVVPLVWARLSQTQSMTQWLRRWKLRWNNRCYSTSSTFYTLQVEVIKTAIKNTTVKKAARKKRGAGYGDENIEPPTVTQGSLFLIIRGETTL